MKILDDVNDTMSVKYYDKERNELEVWGCSTCPFLWWVERGTDYKPFCPFDNHIDLPKMAHVNDVPEKFPENCPIRAPNFKLTRHIEENIIKEE